MALRRLCAAATLRACAVSTGLAVMWLLSKRERPSFMAYRSGIGLAWPQCTQWLGALL
jgi:hypothetical protein